MVNSKNKQTLSPPGRCGLQPHRIGTVGNSAYQTGERWVRFPNHTGLECLINSKIYYKCPYSFTVYA